MADDLLPPVDPPPAPTPAPPSRHRQVTCEYCECRLTGDGEIIAMGGRAKRFRTADEKIEALTAEKESLTRQLAAVTEECTALRAKDAPAGDKRW